MKKNFPNTTVSTKDRRSAGKSVTVQKKSAMLDLDPEVTELNDILQWAFSSSTWALQIFDELQSLYDNEPGANWPTISRVPVPLLFNAVDKALPEVYDAMFPIGVSLTPSDDEEVDMESVEKSEFLLHRILNKEMNLQYKAMTTLRDMFKFSVGFGIVEPFMISPPASSLKVVQAGGKQMQHRSIEPGRPVPSVRYKYASPAQVIVTPDGSEFNGDNRVSVAFYIDSYSEAQIFELYRSQPEGALKGDPEHLIQRARANGFGARIPLVDMVARLSGMPLQGVQQCDPNLPVRIPVVKAYEENRITWYANGEDIIYQVIDLEHTLRCPLVKACPWNDGVRFYPSTPTTVSRRIVKGYNQYIGCLFDLLSTYWNPPLLYDRQRFPDGAPKRGPNEDWAAIGDIQNAAKYMDTGHIPQEVLAIGQLVKGIYGESVNQPEFLNAGSPGVVRAGAGAFGDLTRNMSIRDGLKNIILSTGWLQNVIQNAIIISQTTMPDTGRRIRKRTVKEGKTVLETLKITPDDFVRAFEFSIDDKAAFLRSATGTNLANGYLAAMKDDPLTDNFALRMEVATVIFGEERARKIHPMSKEQAAKQQQDQQQMVLQERAKNLARGQAAPGGSGQSVESGALTGGANNGGGAQ